MAMATMYDQLGGAEGVADAVDDFYARLLADPELGHHFDGAAMLRQIHHFRAFLAAALDGPRRYLGRDLRRAHGGAGITDAAFDRAVEHLVATLRHVGVPTPAIAELGSRLTPLRAHVVTA
jgi:hemoglobin